jgi:hypothetical protein
MQVNLRLTPGKIQVTIAAPDHAFDYGQKSGLARSLLLQYNILDTNAPSHHESVLTRSTARNGERRARWAGRTPPSEKKNML